MLRSQITICFASSNSATVSNAACARTYNMANASVLPARSSTEPDIKLQQRHVRSSPLREDNFRIYYARKEESDCLIRAFKAGKGTVCRLRGTYHGAVTAPGGDHLLVWLPGAVGLVGFLSLPEQPMVNTGGCGALVTEALVEQILDPPVKSKKLFPALANKPQKLTTPFGTRVREVGILFKTSKYVIDTDSLLKIGTELWCKAEVCTNNYRADAGLADRKHEAHILQSHLQASYAPQQVKKRKAMSEMKQLNRAMLLDALMQEGFSQARADQVLDHDSTGWRLDRVSGSDKELTLVFQVFKPDASTPVITAPFETVYKEVAKLWKREFDNSKAKPALKVPRYTRQQERCAAALEGRLQSEGLNAVQQQQMRDMIAEAIRPLAEEQQQQKHTVADMQGAHNALAANMAIQSSQFQQLMPALQQIAAGLSWAQHAQQQPFALPASSQHAAPVPFQYAPAPLQNAASNFAAPADSASVQHRVHQ